MTLALPKHAISIRQPWAWAIMHGRKDIENRNWTRFGVRGPVCIHAAASMTRKEYDDAAEFIRKVSGDCPAPHELVRGAILGTVEVVDMVRKHDSPWFFGPVGLVLRAPEPIEPIPAVGQLGFFPWQPIVGGKIIPPAKWMLPAHAHNQAKGKQLADVPTPLFEDRRQ